MTEQTRFRCAIYTRKSSEEGLDQDFNSIQAQREAGEAYIRSQAHEGWVLAPDHYDDGGFSGGNMERPALKSLMEDVRAGKIDIVVIYKIDRLTRSLTDFARLAETFDQHKVSFVSVTQQFNTTNSMGRLMLNVLLSFAQFEREITGERIRDKIAASKKKGMWMGGPVPIGYQVQDRRLVIYEPEADTVRTIFHAYLDCGDVPSLLTRLGAQGVTTAPRQSVKGKASGGRAFTRGHIYKLLSNPLYVGKVMHKNTSHPGQHEPIIDKATWAAVQSQLSSNTQGPRQRRRRAEPAEHYLADILVSADVCRFVPTHANKGARRYRYYVEDVVAPATSRRLPAREMDIAVVTALTDYLKDDRQLASDLEMGPHMIGSLLAEAKNVAMELLASRPDGATLLRTLLSCVIYREGQIELKLRRRAVLSRLGWRDHDRTERENYQIEDDEICFRAPLEVRRRGKQLKLAIPTATGARRQDTNQSLVTVISRARDWAERISSGASPINIGAQDGVTPAYVSHVLHLAFLSPVNIERILLGDYPADLTADKLIWKSSIALSWADQASLLSS